MKDKIKRSLEIIEKAIYDYPKIAIFCSFGKDSITTLHLCRQIKPNIQVVSIMTPYKFKETFAYKDYITALWQLNIKTYKREINPLIEPRTEECCDYYKVTPAKQAVEELGLKAWISGMRATEGETRRNIPIYQEDIGLMKINPILDFTETEIYIYHLMNGIPIHPLYTLGYRSLGCEKCTLPGGEFEREGRFANTNRSGGECRIHSFGLKTGKLLCGEKSEQ